MLSFDISEGKFVMDTHIDIIREMLQNIRNCPKGRCGACKKSVEVALSSLDTLVERIDDIESDITPEQQAWLDN